MCFPGFGGETNRGERSFDVCVDGPFVCPLFFSGGNDEVGGWRVVGGGGKIDGAWIGGVGIFLGGVVDYGD